MKEKFDIAQVIDGSLTEEEAAMFSEVRAGIISRIAEMTKGIDLGKMSEREKDCFVCGFVLSILMDDYVRNITKS